ncbi:MAG: hypothetical protein M1814_004411 [Vezdaea aestivalis]|nr:MAG: hypothetical protein M1814_004411 [Vezdaea aestivalis]
MSDGFGMVFTLSAVMGLASFLAGMLPLSFTMSHSRRQLLSALGMGVLVGTSLVVIIPEGIETLYSAGASESAHHSHHKVGSLEARVSLRQDHMYRPAGRHLDDPNPVAVTSGKGSFVGGFIAPSTVEVRAKIHNSIPRHAEQSKPKLDDQVTSSNSRKQQERPESSKIETQKTAQASSPHGWVGVSLLLGFILMYLIDEVPQLMAGKKQNKPETFHISLHNLSRGLHRSSSTSTIEEARGFNPSKLEEPSSRSTATTTGLVIHSAADGIALGASSSSANHGLGMIVFLAIMLHKAPAAFGLTSILLKQGLSKRKARAHLAIFSLAAPVGALLTWSVVHMNFEDRVADAGRTQWWTGVLLLFSGGTFLWGTLGKALKMIPTSADKNCRYVAMHAMQEVATTHKAPSPNGLVDGSSSLAAAEEDTSFQCIGAAICGMLLPLITQVGHVH